MKTVNVYEAKTTFSKLVQAIRSGEEREIVISLSGKPVAKIVPYEAPQRRPLGGDEGLITIADDFDELPPEIMAAFEGRS